MATYGVAVSRTEYIQGQCYSSWPCGRISATILCVVACGVITFRCAEASLKRQHLHATWKRRASETHARTHACTHACTYTSCARACVECGKYKKKKKERVRERGRGKKKARGCHVSRIEGDNGFLFHPCGASSCLSGLWLHEWIVVLRLHCARFPVLRCGNCCPPWHLHRPIPHHFSGLFSLASFFPPSPESFYSASLTLDDIDETMDSMVSFLQFFRTLFLLSFFYWFDGEEIARSSIIVSMIRIKFTQCYLLLHAFFEETMALKMHFRL